MPLQGRCCHDLFVATFCAALCCFVECCCVSHNFTAANAGNQVDKIVPGREAAWRGGDPSSEGVQRDLLPIIVGVLATCSVRATLGSSTFAPFYDPAGHLPTFNVACLCLQEGSTIQTKHGNVNTDHILFICRCACALWGFKPGWQLLHCLLHMFEEVLIPYCAWPCLSVLCSGAFHSCKPSDLMAELQVRNSVQVARLFSSGAVCWSFEQPKMTLV